MMIMQNEWTLCFIEVKIHKSVIEKKIKTHIQEQGSLSLKALSGFKP